MGISGEVNLERRSNNLYYFFSLVAISVCRPYSTLYITVL